MFSSGLNFCFVSCFSGLYFRLSVGILHLSSLVCLVACSSGVFNFTDNTRHINLYYNFFILLVISLVRVIGTTLCCFLSCSLLFQTLAIIFTY